MFIILGFITSLLSLPLGVLSFAGPELKVSNMTETKVHVEWTTVAVPNRIIEKYQVSAYPVKSYGKLEMLNRNEWTFYNTTFRSDLVGLHPGTLYNISVWAITSDGPTEPTTSHTWTEVLNLNTYTTKSDVWSFGVVLWEIMTIGGSPYNGLFTRDILPRVMQGMRLPQPKGIYDELYQLMLHCWELDADERPKFMEMAASLQSMFLNTKEHINLQDCHNYQYEKFDPSAEDQ